MSRWIKVASSLEMDTPDKVELPLRYYFRAAENLESSELTQAKRLLLARAKDLMETDAMLQEATRLYFGDSTEDDKSIYQDGDILADGWLWRKSDDRETYPTDDNRGREFRKHMDNFLRRYEHEIEEKIIEEYEKYDHDDNQNYTTAWEGIKLETGPLGRPMAYLVNIKTVSCKDIGSLKKALEGTAFGEVVYIDGQETAAESIDGTEPTDDAGASFRNRDAQDGNS
jgi:hypothetical protein